MKNFIAALPFILSSSYELTAALNILITDLKTKYRKIYCPNGCCGIIK